MIPSSQEKDNKNPSSDFKSKSKKTSLLGAKALNQHMKRVRNLGNKRPIIFLFVPFLAFFLSPILANAEVESYPEINEQLLTITKKFHLPNHPEQTLTLHVRRFKRSGAQPILLNHAVVLNNIAMRKLAYNLWKKGYDVWMPNLRGHGNGLERSIVSPYLPGDYSFDYIVTLDLPTIVDYIHERTKQKIHVIGLSMGGMVSEKFLTGIYLKENGELGHDVDLAKQRAEKVLSYTSMVAPADLTQVPQSAKTLAFPFIPFLRHLHLFIPLTHNRDPKNDNYSLPERARKNLVNLFELLLPRLLPWGIVNPASLEEGEREFSLFLEDSLSSPHTDYVYDFLSWLFRGYASRDEEVDYAETRSIFVPTLIMVGGKDGLVPPTYTIRMAQDKYPRETSLRFFYYCDYAHLDFALKRPARDVSAQIANFLSNTSDPIQHKEIRYVGENCRY